jgi:hypothetical protein
VNSQAWMTWREAGMRFSVLEPENVCFCENGGIFLSWSSCESDLANSSSSLGCPLPYKNSSHFYKEVMGPTLTEVGDAA